MSHPFLDILKNMVGVQKLQIPSNAKVCVHSPTARHHTSPCTTETTSSSNILAHSGPEGGDTWVLLFNILEKVEGYYVERIQTISDQEKSIYWYLLS